MIFIHLQYIFILLALSIGVFIAAQKYFSLFMIRTEDYYLLLALIFIFLNYLLQYLVIIHGQYVSHVVYMSHSFKVLGFWGFCSFLLAQIPFKKNKQYRKIKIFLFLVFMLPLITILSIPCITNNELYTLTNLQHQLSLLTNIQSDIVVELMCLLSTFTTLFLIKHFAHMKQKILYSSTVIISISYILNLFNLLRFKGLSYTIFVIANTLTLISLLLMLVVVFYYFKDEKAKYEESNKRLVNVQKVYQKFTIDKAY